MKNGKMRGQYLNIVELTYQAFKVRLEWKGEQTRELQ
jgi:hypothetical protein